VIVRDAGQITLRGLDTDGSSGVVNPMTPTRSPRIRSTCVATMVPRSACDLSVGSPLTSRFALTNGTEPRKPSMNCAVTSGPKSNSWLPMADRS